MIDLYAYFARIGYHGERTPTLAALRAIHRLHPQAIPFENLNPLLRWPAGLNATSLERKLVREGRGGYCFEHNLLLRHVLHALGYRTTALAARVMWTAPVGVMRPRSHMLLRVEVEGDPYIADVGFGGRRPATGWPLARNLARSGRQQRSPVPSGPRRGGDRCRLTGQAGEAGTLLSCAATLLLGRRRARAPRAGSPGRPPRRIPAPVRLSTEACSSTG